MATDVEESDTDDHERPAPPKRQCTRIAQVNDTSWAAQEARPENQAVTEETEQEYDDAERHAREKLKRWQACQVAKGFVDNTINRVLENYIMNSPASYPIEVSRFHLFRGNEMEDTAVMMAIRNHGLVQSNKIVSQSSAFYSDKAPGYWTDSNYADVQCSCPSNRVQGVRDLSESTPTTSTDPDSLGSQSDMEQYNSDQPENFLERAVAEAIKKKGLSALSVDYG